MVQVASVFDQFCDLRLALSCSMARCSFQALCDAHHLILSFVTRMFCWRAATLTALFGAPHFPSPHLKGAGFSSRRPGSTGLTLSGGEAPAPPLADLSQLPDPLGYRNHSRGTHSEGTPQEAAKSEGQAAPPCNFNLAGVCHLSASQLIRSSRTDLIKDIIELIVRWSIVIRMVY